MVQDSTADLLGCLSYADGLINTDRIKAVRPSEWRDVAVLAQQHGIAPLLYHRLNALGVALPDDVAEGLKKAYRQNLMRNLRLYHELGKLLLQLQEKGIDIIVLKGAHIAESMYENIGLRSMSDIDILAREDDLMLIEEVLFSLGFKPLELNRVVSQYNKHFRYSLSGADTDLEIHWTIKDHGHPYKIDIDGFWIRARPLTLAQAPAMALSPEDLILHLCLHTATHARVMRLRMLCDIGEVTRRHGANLDWEWIAAEARRCGIVRSVYVILRLARELLNVSVPVDFLSLLQPAGFNELYFSVAHKQMVDYQHTSMVGIAAFWKAEGLGGKLAVVRKNLLPPRDMMSLTYPAPANSWKIYLYYPVRIKEIVLRKRTTLWRLITGDTKSHAEAKRGAQLIDLKNWLLSG